MYGHFYDTDLFNLGVVVNQAINNPDGLKKLDPSRQMSAIDAEAIPAMLRRPMDKTKRTVADA